MLFLLVLLSVGILYAGYLSLRFVLAYRLIVASRGWVGYSKAGGDRRMLIIGDSILAGLGSTPEGSIAGLAARDFPQYSIRNLSQVGLTVSGLLELIRKEIEIGNRYDTFLFDIGPNDLFSGTDAVQLRRDMEQVFIRGRVLAPEIIYLAGNAGALPILPWFAKNYLERKSARTMTPLLPLMKQHGIRHADVFVPWRRDPLLRNRRACFSKDMVHPTEHGYALWYPAIKRHLEDIERLQAKK